MKYLLALLFLATASAASISIPKRVDFCPPTEELRPCSCTSFTGIEFHCDGPQITQESIQNVIDTIRLYNPDEPHLQLYRFWLFDTELVTLDLVPFTNVSFNYVHFQNNVNLTFITGSGPPTISITTLRISNSPLLWNNGFIRLLVPSTLKFAHHMITSISTDGSPDFLAGLGTQHQLDTFQLESSGRETKKIGGGQFRNFSRIRHISLSKIGLEEVGADAFVFDEYPPDFTSALFIGLKNNRLTDASIHKDHGLDKVVSRNVIIYLENNQLETLSQEKFEPLVKGRSNQLRVYDNVIVCDERVKWLKDGKQMYERWVMGADCVNDPGKTVFTSTLIP